MSLAITNPQLGDLAPDLRGALGEVLLFMADSELVVGHRHSEWTGFAPSAEEDVAFSSIAQDEMGHAHLYYALITGADDETAVDQLALDRGPRAFRHLPLLHAPNGDWFFTSARHLYWDVFEDVFLRAMLDSRLPLIPSAAQRLLNEEALHLEHADEWAQLLSSSKTQREHLVAAMVSVIGAGGFPPALIPAFHFLSREGLVTDPVGLAGQFQTAINSHLEAAGWTSDELESAAAAWTPTMEAPATAPAGLYKLHRDLTGLRRTHPGASW